MYQKQKQVSDYIAVHIQTVPTRIWLRLFKVSHQKKPKKRRSGHRSPDGRNER